MPKRKIEKIDDSGRFSYDGLERVIHEKARLGILTSLAGKPAGLSFGELKDMCSLTDGNLSRHLTILSEAGLVAIWKGVFHNRPQTITRLTPEGKKRFLDYISVLESVVRDAVGADAKAAARKTADAESEAGGLAPA